MNHPEILGVTFHPSGIAKERKRSLASPAIFLGSSRYLVRSAAVYLGSHWTLFLQVTRVFPTKKNEDGKIEQAYPRRSWIERYPAWRRQNASATSRRRTKTVAIRRRGSFFLPRRENGNVSVGWCAVFHPRVSFHDPIPPGWKRSWYVKFASASFFHPFVDVDVDVVVGYYSFLPSTIPSSRWTSIRIVCHDERSMHVMLFHVAYAALAGMHIARVRTKRRRCNRFACRVLRFIARVSILYTRQLPVPRIWDACKRLLNI